MRSGLGDLPRAVDGAVLVFHGHGGLARGRLVQNPVDGAVRVRVEHEKLAEMRAGVAQQFHAVALGTRQRLLVPVYDAGRVILDRAKPDEALAREALAGVGNRELLEVGEQARLGFARQNAGADPVLQMPRRARVDVVGLAVAGRRFAQDDADRIVPARREITLAHGRRNLVVGLGGQESERTRGWSVAIRVEREYLSHGGIPRIAGTLIRGQATKSRNSRIK